MKEASQINELSLLMITWILSGTGKNKREILFTLKLKKQSYKKGYTYWGKGPGKAEKNPEFMFEKQEKPVKSFHLGIEEKDSRKIVGDLYIYLIENDRMASVAIRFAPVSQGKGYGTEALSAITLFCFQKTELQRLWTEVDVRNISSQKMLEKCGYTREGMIRQGKMINTWCDYYIYGILKSDMKMNKGY